MVLYKPIKHVIAITEQMAYKQMVANVGGLIDTLGQINRWQYIITIKDSEGIVSREQMAFKQVAVKRVGYFIPWTNNLVDATSVRNSDVSMLHRANGYRTNQL